MKGLSGSKRPEDVREEGLAIEVEKIADLELPVVLADDVQGGRCVKADGATLQTYNP